MGLYICIMGMFIVCRMMFLKLLLCMEFGLFDNLEDCKNYMYLPGCNCELWEDDFLRWDVVQVAL